MIRVCIKNCWVLLFLVGCKKNVSNSELSEVSELSYSINTLLKESTNTSLDDSTRFSYAIKAKRLANENKTDSLISKSLLELVKLSYPLKDKDSFLLYYPKSLSFSKQIKDTLNTAQTHNYTAYFYLKNNAIDSAYYHFYQGFKYFELLHDDYQMGKMLLNMAIIQKNQRDYKGSEEVTKQALDHLIKTDDKRYIASAYNNLGIVNNELKKLTVSIAYHLKALSLRKAFEKKDDILVVESMNNIAVAYKDNGDYENAFAYFDSIQPYMELLESNSVVKARIIDNRAHAKLLTGETKNVLSDMKKALLIRKTENHLSGIMISLLHLAEYFHFTNNPEKSFQYALEAKTMSQKHQNLRDMLNALRILSLNESNIDNKPFIREYYSTIDTVEKTENSVSDAFARIRFEADEKDRENRRATKIINEQINLIESKNFIIGLLVCTALLFLGLLYLLWRVSKYRQELYREFNHRTKNNLIEIQRGIVKAKNGNDSAGNILYLESVTQSQLLLYSILEKKGHPSHVQIDSYIKELIYSILLVYNEYESSAHFDMVEIKVDSKKASLIGLIVNEFITNAFKHAFTKEKKNRVEAVCSVSGSNLILMIRTSGQEWNPEVLTGKGDGLVLIKSLAKKIPAKSNVQYKEGMTSLSLILKK